MFNVFILRPKKASKKRNRVRRLQAGENSSLAISCKGKDVGLSNLLSEVDILKEDIIQEMNAVNDPSVHGFVVFKEIPISTPNKLQNAFNVSSFYVSPLK